MISPLDHHYSTDVILLLLLLFLQLSSLNNALKMQVRCPFSAQNPPNGFPSQNKDKNSYNDHRGPTESVTFLTLSSLVLPHLPLSQAHIHLWVPIQPALPSAWTASLIRKTFPPHTFRFFSHKGFLLYGAFSDHST